MDKKSRLALIDKRFSHAFGTPPEGHFSSPGRLELLGNHTDHNHGLVLVSAVDLDILAAASKNNTNHIVCYSDGFADMDVDLADLSVHPQEKGQSASVIRGVAYYFTQKGYAIGGLNLVLDSAIFPGAGVSSSAAFELLICEALNHFYNRGKLDKVELAKIAQKSETDYFGKPCGLLDQMGVALGGVNFIDFASTASPQYKHLDFTLEGYTAILTNTGGSHANLTPLYQAIKDDMRTIAHHFGKTYLREVTYREFRAKKEELIKAYGSRPFLRARHFFMENDRVRKAYVALRTHDAKTFIEMVQTSGNSSRLNLKNTSAGHPAKEALSQGLKLSTQIIHDGAVRVHGGGFAGTMLAFVKTTEAKAYLKTIQERFGPSNALIVKPRSKGVIYFK